MKFIPVILYLMISCSSVSDVKDEVRSLHQNDDVDKLDRIDDLLGLDYQQAESIALQKKYSGDLAVGWKKEDTQTPYRIIQYFYNHYPPQQRDVVYDLGSGYGRVVFYGASIFPKTLFKGVEVVHERVEECRKILKRHDFRNVTFIESDVLNVDFSDGTYFYFFNPFPEIMDQVLEKLKRISERKKITVVAIARTSRDLRKVAWLKEIHRFDPYRLSVFESR